RLTPGETAVILSTRPLPALRDLRFTDSVTTMRCTRKLLAVLLATLFCSASVPAAEELKSGPQAGNYIPGPFHYLNLNGAHAGNPHCLVCEYGLLPVVTVFVRESGETNRQVEDFLQKLDEAV